MSLRLSTRGRYGVRLMIVLALHYGSTNREVRGITLLRDVSRREEISEKYLGQIVIPLKVAGLVVSQRGIHGGYALARPPETITVKEVVEAIEGRIAAVPCAADPEESGAPGGVDSPAFCRRAAACAASVVWKTLTRDIERSLSSFTLADLAGRARKWQQPVEDYVI